MDELVPLGWLASCALMGITGWTTYRLGRKQERERERRARQIAAAEDLVAPLRAFQGLIRALGRTDLSANEVANTYVSWFSACDALVHRLPSNWQHLPRSVRDATGTVFGGIAFVDIRPDAGALALEAPDVMWQDFADEYLGYCSRMLLSWGEGELSRSSVLMTYEAWLVRTGRRKPIGQN